jgi:hypothetical protein
MLQALQVERLALLSNNPDKAAQLTRLGVAVTDQVPTRVHLSATNAGYLETKAWRGAHTLYFTHSDGRAEGNGAEHSDGHALLVERHRRDEGDGPGPVRRNGSAP